MRNNRVLFLDDGMARIEGTRKAQNQGRRYAICRSPLGYLLKPYDEVRSCDHVFETLQPAKRDPKPTGEWIMMTKEKKAKFMREFADNIESAKVSWHRDYQYFDRSEQLWSVPRTENGAIALLANGKDFRRKPEPVGAWAAILDGGLVYTFANKQDAEIAAEGSYGSRVAYLEEKEP